MNSLLNETGAELLKAMRAPEFIIPTLAMPTAFYAMFAVVLPGSGNTALYLLATYGIFAVMGPALFGFGVGVASEREKGWLQLKRAVPAPAYSYIGAKLAVTLIFAALALLPIYLIAGFGGDVSLDRHIWIGLFAIHLLAAVPFVLLGLTLGFSFSSGGAIAVCNILFLGLALLGGLWFPVFIFPDLMQKLAWLMPTFHLSELALALIDARDDHQTQWNLSISFVMTVVLACLAWWRWTKTKH